MVKPGKVTTQVTASEAGWVLMFCVTILERLTEHLREKTLRSIASYFGFDIAKRVDR